MTEGTDSAAYGISSYGDHGCRYVPVHRRCRTTTRRPLNKAVLGLTADGWSGREMSVSSLAKACSRRREGLWARSGGPGCVARGFRWPVGPDSQAVRGVRVQAPAVWVRPRLMRFRRLRAAVRWVSQAWFLVVPR